LFEVCPKILIVDDEENNRYLQKQYLSGIGVEILEAETGEEAIAFLDKTIPHLIISDITMPGMGGFKFLERIKISPRTKSIPVIMVTANTDTKNRERAFQLKADDYVTKPIHREDFIPRVRRFVQ
jgi:CheY-like chemotaxis protein